MKREFLKNFKVGDQELPKEIIDAILDENGRDIEAAKAKFGDYDALKDQLAEANRTIESFKDMDIEGVRKEAGDWKDKFEQAERDHAAKLAEIEFNGMLSAAIAGANGKNAKAITALLDVDALKGSRNQETDIKAALDALREENGYLFDAAETPPPYAAGTGRTSVMGQITKEAFTKMGYRERLELKRSNPEIYEQVKEN